MFPFLIEISNMSDQNIVMGFFFYVKLVFLKLVSNIDHNEKLELMLMFEL
jgi:hypothetical protein